MRGKYSMERPAKIHRDGAKKSAFNEKLTSMITEQPNNLAVIPMLFEADVHSPVDSCDNTFLHIAAECNNKVATQCLISLAGNIDAPNSLGKTPLILAIENQCRDTIDLLLDANASIFISDNEGKNALHYFLDSHWFRDCLLLRKLLKNVEIQCDNDCEVIASKLIDAGWPLPCITLLLKDTEVTRVMLKLGCSVDARELIYHRTALHQAVSTGNVELASLLLDYNADPNALDTFNRAPLSYVYWQKECTSDERVIQCAKIVKLLIDRGATLHTPYDSLSHVNDILVYGNREAIEILLQAANLDLTKKRGNGDTAVHVLARNRNPEVCEILVGRNIDVNAVNFTLETPLCIAASIGNECMVEFLLERGANVNAVNAASSSPLYRCIQQFSAYFGPRRPTFNANNLNVMVLKYKRCAQLLLEHHANVLMEVREFGQPITVFDFLRDLESYFIGDLLIAHLVLQEASGRQMSDRLRDRINSRNVLKKDYELYKRQGEIEVYKSVTLLDLLTESDFEFERRLRYKEWVSRLQKYFDECDSKSGYFHDILQRRFFKTTRIIELRKRVACYFCEIVKIDSLIADNIVSYLCEPDLQYFLQVIP